MTATLEEIQEAATALGPKERAALALFVMANLDEETIREMRIARQEEIRRRLAEIKSGKAIGVPIEEALPLLYPPRTP